MRSITKLNYYYYYYYWIMRGSCVVHAVSKILQLNIAGGCLIKATAVYLALRYAKTFYFASCPYVHPANKLAKRFYINCILQAMHECGNLQEI